MPVTQWVDVAGRQCEQCGGPATHIYGGSFICCDCHAGEGNGLCTQEEAWEMHRAVVKEMAVRLRRWEGNIANAIVMMKFGNTEGAIKLLQEALGT